MLGVIPIAQLKYIYTDAYSMGSKQEELEAIVQWDNYDLVTIIETWWGDSVSEARSGGNSKSCDWALHWGGKGSFLCQGTRQRAWWGPCAKKTWLLL